MSPKINKWVVNCKRFLDFFNKSLESITITFYFCDREQYIKVDNELQEEMRQKTSISDRPSTIFSSNQGQK